MNTTTFIYTLSDPITNLVKYVGKSDNPKRRYLDHIKNVDLKNKRFNNKKTCWIKSIKQKGLLPILSIIDEVPISEWQKYEINYIKLYKSLGANLVNGTLGGDGVVCTDEVRKKMSDSQKISIKTYSVESKERMRKLGRERVFTKERNEKISASKKNKKISEKQKIDISKKLSWRKVIQLSKNNEFIAEWENTIVAAKFLKCHFGSIGKCCNGKRKTALGYIWKYKNT